VSEANAIVLRLQARGDHSEDEIRTHLERRGFSRLEIEAAVDWGRAHAALDNARATEVTVRQELEKGRGALRVQARLERRGLDPDAFSVSAKEELERAKAALLSRLTKYAGDPAKAAAWLGRQGFEEDVAMAAVDLLIGLPEG
jgi:regulatory protein